MIFYLRLYGASPFVVLHVILDLYNFLIAKGERYHPQIKLLIGIRLRIIQWIMLCLIQAWATGPLLIDISSLLRVDS